MHVFACMSSRRPTWRRPLAVAALATVPGLAWLAAPGAAPAQAATPPGFATPSPVDPVNLFGEPDLRQDPSSPNVWYSSGPWGTGTQISIWDRSLDGAHTFRELHDHPDPLHTGGSLRFPPGGGDTEIALDHTGKLYAADLGALVSQKTITSTDQGRTLQEQPLPRVFRDTNGGGTDRQWLAEWDPKDPAAARAHSAYKGPFPVSYMVYLQAVGANCPYSSNNGSIACETVASSVPPSSGDTAQVGLDYGCDATSMGSANCPIWPVLGDGPVFIDQLTGKVVQAFDYQDPSKKSSPDSAAVSVMTPGASGYMATAQEHLITTLKDASATTIFPVIAEDSSRNAYYVWAEQPAGDRTPTSWQIFYSWSPPGADSEWDHWSAPIQVSRPPARTNLMPWMVAGADGMLDVAWYGTDSPTSDPQDEGNPQTADASWYLYMAQLSHADSAHPQITQVQAYDRPMHHGSICLLGLNCITIQGNRNLADFFEIVTDPQGAAYIVFDDTANDLIQQVPVVQQPLPEGVVDHKGAELVEVVRQVSGMGLNGTPVHGTDDRGVSGIRSASGDALYDPITGTNQPGLDIEGVSLTAQGDTLRARVDIADPSQTAADAQAIGAPFVDVVVRWEYQSQLYFAVAEIPAAGGTPSFFDGQSQTIDLCSVSACDPHVLTYPGPAVAPNTSHSTTGTLTAGHGATPGSITIDIPRADVGGPRDGQRLDSVGAYSLASLLSFDVPLPNAMAEDDIVPLEVDGACCFTPTLGAHTVTQTFEGVSGPLGRPSGGVQAAGTLPNTSAGRAAAPLAGTGAVLGVAALLGRRRRQRGGGRTAR